MKSSVGTRVVIVVCLILASNILAGAVSWYLYSAAASSGAEARASAQRARLVAEASTAVTEFMASATDLGYSVSRPTASEERSRLYGALIGAYPVADRAMQRVAEVTQTGGGGGVQGDWASLRTSTFAWINSEAQSSGASMRLTRGASGTYRDSVSTNISLPADLSGLSPAALRTALRDRAEHLKYSTLGDVAKAADAAGAKAASAEATARFYAQVGAVLFAALSVLIAAIAGIWLYTSISGPLLAARKYADDVAAGDYAATLARHSSDEIGVLTRAVENMKDNLVHEMSVIREMAGVVMFTAEGVKDAVASTAKLVDRPSHQAEDVKAGLSDVETRVDVLQDLSRQMLGL